MHNKIIPYKSFVALTLGLIFLIGGVALWWRLWMYHGMIGPIPFLHWIIESNGEFTYDLTEYEMFIHLILLVIAVHVAQYLISLDKIVRKSCEPDT